MRLNGMKMSSLTYDFILFTPFDRARALGVYKIAKVLRDQGCSVKVIDFLQSFVKKPLHLLLWLQEHIHENTVFGFSGTFMSFAIINSVTEASTTGKFYGREMNKNDVPNLTRDYRYREKYKKPSELLVKDNFKNFIDDLKSDFPKNKIVIGGAGFISEFIFRNLPIDHLFLGYGEDAAAKELIDIFKRKEVPDVIHQNLSDLKYDFHNSGSSFHDSDGILPNEVLPLEISRGCRFNCKFCGFALRGRKMSDQYFRHESKIFDELMHNYKLFGTTNYNILCDTFNESNEKLIMVKGVFDKFYEITGEKIQFNAYLRLELMKRFPEQISILRDMGIVAAQLGIETLNYASAKAIGKGIATQDVYDTVKKMRESWGDDVRIHSGFILGLPHETKETATKWLTSLYKKELDLTSWRVVPLRINTNKLSDFTSVFDREAEKYGYDIVSTKIKVEGKGVWINQPISSEEWKNEHWSSYECSKIATEWGTKFDRAGIVKFVDNPWGYLNYKNGIIEGKNLMPTSDMVKNYHKQLFQA
jgi:radical SAM superfamily enzyme YgiQ (UPF0313 family)